MKKKSHNQRAHFWVPVYLVQASWTPQPNKMTVEARKQESFAMDCKHKEGITSFWKSMIYYSSNDFQAPKSQFLIFQ